MAPTEIPRATSDTTNATTAASFPAPGRPLGTGPGRPFVNFLTWYPPPGRTAETVHRSSTGPSEHHIDGRARRWLALPRRPGRRRHPRLPRSAWRGPPTSPAARRGGGGPSGAGAGGGGNRPPVEV